MSNCNNTPENNLSSNIKYDGPNLFCSSINTCDNLNVAFTKINNISCDLIEDVFTITSDVNNLTTILNNIQTIINIVNTQLGVCCPTTTTTTTQIITTTTTSTTEIIPTTTTTTTNLEPTTTTTTTETPVTTTTTTSSEGTTTTTTTTVLEPTTTTTTTTVMAGLYLGLISSSSDISNACGLTLPNPVWVSLSNPFNISNGDVVYLDSGGTTNFIGDGNYWKITIQSEVEVYSGQVSSLGVISNISLCP
jgi:hypothetical protein